MPRRLRRVAKRPDYPPWLADALPTDDWPEIPGGDHDPLRAEIIHWKYFKSSAELAQARLDLLSRG